jgi:hypothetical protein
VQPQVEEVLAPAVACLFYDGLSSWHLGKIASSHASMAEAISLAKGLNDAHALAAALHFAGFIGHFERNPAEVERLASETAFDEAIRTALQQKSISLLKRADETYAAYRRQKASGSEGRGF